MKRLVWSILLVAATLMPVRAEAQDAQAAQDVAVPADAREETLFDLNTLSDPELALARGGFTLPGGIEVSLAAVITTDVNGARLLQTVFQVGRAGADATTQALGGGVTRLDPRGGTITASLAGLNVEHVIGQRLGTLIANSGDNRTIDNQISIDLSLGNVQPLALGSAMFRVQSLGTDAAIWRATGG